MSVCPSVSPVATIYSKSASRRNFKFIGDIRHMNVELYTYRYIIINYPGGLHVVAAIWP